MLLCSSPPIETEAERQRWMMIRIAGKGNVVGGRVRRRERARWEESRRVRRGSLGRRPAAAGRAGGGDSVGILGRL